MDTLGFNVRRRRNQAATASLVSVPEKIFPTTNTSTLAFAATSPQTTNNDTHPTKPIVRSLSKHNTTKLKANKRHLSKDPKQSTLLPFLCTTTLSTKDGSANAIAVPLQNEEPTTWIPQQQQQQPAATKLPTTESHQINDEESVLCRLRRSIATVDLLVLLEEAFGINTYDSSNDNDNEDPMSPNERQGQLGRKQHDTAIPLLQVKPSKVIYFPVNNSGVIIGQHRRRYQEHEQGNKRPCLTTSNRRNQQPISSFMDEWDSQQRQDSIEITTLRRSLSSVQMASLLLDIANDFMAFENNNWCISYLD